MSANSCSEFTMWHILPILLVRLWAHELRQILIEVDIRDYTRSGRISRDGDSALEEQRRTKVLDKEASSAGWRPQGLNFVYFHVRAAVACIGLLVAHLHEHRGAITSMDTSADGLMMATSSTDGLVKIWDGQRFDRHPTMRSRLTYEGHTTAVSKVVFLDNARSFVSATDSGSIHINRLFRLAIVVFWLTESIELNFSRTSGLKTGLQSSNPFCHC